MTHLQVTQMIQSLNIPCGYDFFSTEEKQKPPYIVYYYLDDDDFYADNINYQPVRPLNIDLYTRYKDITLEKSVENLLTSNGLSYTRNERFIEDENENLVSYTINIVITE